MKKIRQVAEAAILFGMALISISHASSSQMPDAARLAKQVTIRRDTYGIPHILAETEEAAAFGFGYAQAEDHCVTIAQSLVSARGEQARYFGTGMESDFLLKLYENMRMSEQDLRGVSTVYRKMMHAYAAGINLYVAEHRSELPSWIPAFTGIDIMASRRAGSIRSTFSQTTIRALQRKYPPANPKRTTDYISDLADLINSLPDPAAEPEPPGSNAFALSGARTASGNPILLGNPHLSWSSLYWEAQVTVPGKVNFFGSTLAGIPVLRAGFNEQLGWVTTNNSPDLMDVFALPLDPGKPDHYLFDGKSLPLIKEEVTVEIREKDGTLRKETREFWDTYSQGNAQPFRTPWDPQKPASTPSGIANSALALKHLEDAARWTRQTYGSEDVAWGEVHRFRFGALDLPGDGANGTYGLFRVVRFADMPDGKRVAGQVQENELPVGFGDGWVIAVQFSKPIQAMSVLAYGQTTRSASKHSSDQIRLFAAHQLRPIWFTEAEIKANLEREYHPGDK